MLILTHYWQTHILSVVKYVSKYMLESKSNNCDSNSCFTLLSFFQCYQIQLNFISRCCGSKAHLQYQVMMKFFWKNQSISLLMADTESMKSKRFVSFNRFKIL